MITEQNRQIPHKVYWICTVDDQLQDYMQKLQLKEKENLGKYKRNVDRGRKKKRPWNRDKQQKLSNPDWQTRTDKQRPRNKDRLTITEKHRLGNED